MDEDPLKGPAPDSAPLQPPSRAFARLDNIADDQVDTEITESVPTRVSNVQKEYRARDNKMTRAVGGAATRGVGIAAQAGGTVLEGTGKGITTTSRAAAAIPVVGSSVAAVGGVLGLSATRAGKEASRSGRIFNRVGRLSRRTDTQAATPSRRSVPRSQTTRTNQNTDRYVPGLSIFGGTISAERAKKRADRLRYLGMGVAVVVLIINILLVAALIQALASLTPVGLASEVIADVVAESVLGFTVEWVPVLYFLGVGIALIYLFISRSFMGRVANLHSVTKDLLFMAAFVLYCFPFINAYPWANFWLKTVGKNPE